jgi:NADH dehydrogenase [ubiquinone] 1 alpha subcomplex assembly factor 1
LYFIKQPIVMNFLFLLLLINIPINTIKIFNFNKNSNIYSWRIVDDIVMGGRSSSNITLNEDGFGVFSGVISVENNGGFSSVRHVFKALKVTDQNKIYLKIKGDGKNYQLRIKDNSRNYYSYIKIFSTSGLWQEIEIPLKEMYPSFRGRKLNSPNFSHDSIEEIVFLIGNKKNESFQLIIDKIELK